MASLLRTTWTCCLEAGGSLRWWQKDESDIDVLDIGDRKVGDNANVDVGPSYSEPQSETEQQQSDAEDAGMLEAALAEVIDQAWLGTDIPSAEQGAASGALGPGVRNPVGSLARLSAAIEQVEELEVAEPPQAQPRVRQGRRQDDDRLLVEGPWGPFMITFKTGCKQTIRIHVHVAFMESVWLLWACTAEAGDDMMTKA
jgi:hypothetical protein